MAANRRPTLPGCALAMGTRSRPQGHYVRSSRWLPQRYHEVPRKYRWSCLQMTLRNPLVGACAGRYPPSRRSHKRLLSHRWTVQAHPGDGGDDANAPESSACLHVDYGHPRQPAENHLRRGARAVRAGCSCTARTTAAATRSPSVQIDGPNEVQLSDIEPRFTRTSRGNLRRTGCTVPLFTSIAARPIAPPRILGR